MSQSLRVVGCAGYLRNMAGQQLLRCCVFLAALTLVGESTVTLAQDLPPGGATTWEIQELEVVVTFLLFDPKAPGIDLPDGLRFISVRDIDAPEFQEHLKNHPEQSDWVFSFVEFARPESWILDGKPLLLPEDEGIGVWFAPVDHSQLAAEVAEDKYASVIAPSPDAVLVLSLWVPDREYVDYMCARGHHAEYGMVTLTQDSSGTLQGEIKLPDLNVKATATPTGEVRNEPDPFTQVFFEPGDKVENVVIITGGNVRERDCTAAWSKKGDHPLSGGAFIDLTFLTREGPIMGSAYHVGEEEDR